MSKTRNEGAFWDAFRKRLNENKGDHHFVRVENSVGEGTPDLNYSILHSDTPREGWIELKCITHWPRSEVVDISHFTPAQRMWIRKRCLAGGTVWVFLKVEDEDQYLLFDGRFASSYLGKVGREDMEKGARYNFRGLSEKSVKRLLTQL